MKRVEKMWEALTVWLVLVTAVFAGVPLWSAFARPETPFWTIIAEQNRWWLFAIIAAALATYAWDRRMRAWR